MGLSRGIRPFQTSVRRGLLAALLVSTGLLTGASPGSALPDLPPILALLSSALGNRQPVLAAGPDLKDAGMIPPGSVIGEVRVVNQDIFDPGKPGENNRIFRIANKLHLNTRAKVIESQLLFRPGDVFSPELIEESARLLRTNDYLYDVQIQPILRPDGKVDVQVATRDVWTLTGGASFSRSGGENNTSFELSDTNFLGLGKEVTISRIGTVDRTSNLVRYRDPNLLGSRARLVLSHAENSDGGRERFELERPFYSLNTRWAAGVRAFRDDRTETLYRAGKITDAFQHRHDLLEVYGGISPGLVAGRTQRFSFGYTYSGDRFDAAPRFPRRLIPENRTLSYPWIGYELVEDQHVVEHDLNRMERSEDLNLGTQASMRLGFSSAAFGGDTDQVILQTAATTGWRPGARQLLLANYGGATRWGSDGTENLVAGGRLRWYARTFGDHLFYASLGADLAERLDDEDQLLLGGDSGLRGYPLRYQEGDRRVLLTLEQRFFSGRELFHLVHVGAAVFFDAGKAWFDGTPPLRLSTRRRATAPIDQQGKLLKDIGLGLRLGSSRSSRGGVVHLDAAFPLDGDTSIKSVQWLVSTSESF